MIDSENVSVKDCYAIDVLKEVKKDMFTEAVKYDSMGDYAKRDGIEICMTIVMRKIEKINKRNSL
jgi:hypothetical protein